MTTKDIIEDKLMFLVKDYGFIFEYSNIQGEHYVFRNDNGYFEFYEWAQFDESEIHVKYDEVFKKINLIEYYPKIIGEFNQTHRGIKWFFKDTRNDYWDMISKIIKLEINNKKSIFGLTI